MHHPRRLPSVAFSRRPAKTTASRWLPRRYTRRGDDLRLKESLGLRFWAFLDCTILDRFILVSGLNGLVGADTNGSTANSGDGRNMFDRVLADAPCSNTGVLRRRPDARWRWSADRLKHLSALQAQILDAAATFVAPGGRLVYSTCSNEPEENGDQVAAFLARRPDFTEVARRESVPFETNHDGAFACALERRRT